MAHDVHSAAFQAQFAREAAARSKQAPVELELSVEAAIALVATIQLALCHPGNRGPTSRLARKVAELVIDKLTAPGSASALRAGLEAGFDRDNDVDRRPAEVDDSPIGDSPANAFVHVVWAFLANGADGSGEGLVVYEDPQHGMLPLVTSVERRLANLRQIAQQLANRDGVSLRLVAFHRGDQLETIDP